MVGGEGYEISTTLPFSCEILKFADDYIRLHFKVEPEAVATVVDSRDAAATTETTVILFKSTSRFRQGVFADYSVDLGGLKSKFMLYRSVSEEWNIYSPDLFSDFQNSPDTTVLAMTQEFLINRQSLDRSSMIVTTTKTILKDYIVDKKVLGFAT